MPLKLVANLSLLFVEYGNMLQRFAAARKFGFRYVECAFPYEHTAEELRTQLTATGLTQVLINTVPGDRLGHTGLPDVSDEEFTAGLHTTRDYLRAMDCRMVHVMSGCPKAGQNRQECIQLYKKRLRESVKFFNTDAKIQVLIEPISYFVNPDYLLNDFNIAVDILDELNFPREQLALQLDIFHLQLMHGDLTRNIKKFLPYSKHVQVAQTPNRTGLLDDGELNYPYILSLIDNCGYSGYIGLEHKPNPTSTTEESLKWVRDLPQAEIGEGDDSYKSLYT